MSTELQHTNSSTIGFTIVIPVYNGADHIERAIESCLQQTLMPEKVIIVDDASTDETEAVVTNIVSGLVHYVRNDKNRGPSYSRNRGMELATSAWIAFLDADDVFHPDKLKLIRYCIESEPAIRAMGHAFSCAEQDLMQPGSFRKADLPPLIRYTGREVLWRNPAVTPSLVVAAANGIAFDEQMPLAEDHDFILRTAEKFGFYYLPLPLCSLQRLPLTPGGISGNAWRMRLGEMRMYRSYCKRHGHYLLLPLLLLFSLLKHIRNWFLKRI